MKRALPPNVRRLAVPLKVHIIRDSGLRGFEREIRKYLHEGTMDLREAGTFIAWARTYVQHLSQIEPTPAEQRRWVENGTRRRAQLAARREAHEQRQQSDADATARAL